jgi:hypothetical protein
VKIRAIRNYAEDTRRPLYQGAEPAKIGQVVGRGLELLRQAG